MADKAMYEILNRDRLVSSYLDEAGRCAQAGTSSAQRGPTTRRWRLRTAAPRAPSADIPGLG